MTTTHRISPDGRPAFQGDVMFRRIERLPSNATLQKGTEHVVAHSETGHHHVSLGGAYYTTPDPFVAYLVTAAPVEIRRQREHTPEGWRRVED